MTGPADWPTTDLLAHRAASTPDRTALVSAGSGESWSYRELDERVTGVAGRLEGTADPGDRVGLLLSNRIEVVELVHAAMRRGATLVPLNVRLTADELRPQVAAADLDRLVCEADTEEVAVEVADRVASVDDPTREEVDSFRQRNDDSPGPVPIDGDREAVREAVVMFTSGTTGDPRGVRLTWGNLLASATASAFRLGVNPDDWWLVPLPTYHMGGLAPVYRSALYGTTVVLQEEFDAGATARAIEEFEVTEVSLVPTMLTRLLDAGWSPPDHLRFVLLGGAPASRELIERCRERGVPVHPTYGMTETASQVATARPEVAFAHPATVGQPLVCTDVRIEDRDGNRCDPGESGEVVVSGPTVSPGYLHDKGAGVAFEDGRFRTGDVGYRDADGRLWVVGRADDRIITGGENVHPGEVVAALRELPGGGGGAGGGGGGPPGGGRGGGGGRARRVGRAGRGAGGARG
jgi:O-succinylbenzoic acid--CoA ligase